jgi:RHS repeat-associated protein
VYVYDAFGELAAEYASQPPALTGTEYYTADHLGSTRLVLGSDGSVKERYDYLPFGEQLGSGVNGRSGKYSTNLADGESVKFTGKERDAESGLDNYLARYYASQQGRFTGPDGPFDDQDAGVPQSWGLYTYGRDNPLLYVDPNGHRVSICPTGGSCVDLSDADYVYYSAGAGIVLPQLHIGDPSYEIDLGQLICGGVVCGTVLYTRDGSLGLQDSTLDIAVSLKSGFAYAKTLLTAGSFIFGMAKSGSQQPISRGFLDLLQTAAKDATGQPVKTGGFAQASRDFDSLDGQAQVRGPVQLKELPDGSKVVLRSFSKDGRPTLEYQPPGGGSKTVWIRYDP